MPDLGTDLGSVDGSGSNTVPLSAFGGGTGVGSLDPAGSSVPSTADGEIATGAPSSVGSGASASPFEGAAAGTSADGASSPMMPMSGAGTGAGAGQQQDAGRSDASGLLAGSALPWSSDDLDAWDGDTGTATTGPAESWATSAGPASWGSESLTPSVTTGDAASPLPGQNVSGWTAGSDDLSADPWAFDDFDDFGSGSWTDAGDDDFTGFEGSEVGGPTTGEVTAQPLSAVTPVATGEQGVATAAEGAPTADGGTTRSDLFGSPSASTATGAAGLPMMPMGGMGAGQPGQQQEEQPSDASGLLVGDAGPWTTDDVDWWDGDTGSATRGPAQEWAATDTEQSTGSQSPADVQQTEVSAQDTQPGAGYRDGYLPVVGRGTEAQDDSSWWSEPTGGVEHSADEAWSAGAWSDDAGTDQGTAGQQPLVEQPAAAESVQAEEPFVVPAGSGSDSWWGDGFDADSLDEEGWVPPAEHNLPLAETSRRSDSLGGGAVPSSVGYVGRPLSGATLACSASTTAPDGWDAPANTQGDGRSPQQDGSLHQTGDSGSEGQRERSSLDLLVGSRDAWGGSARRSDLEALG